MSLVKKVTDTDLEIVEEENGNDLPRPRHVSVTRSLYGVENSLLQLFPDLYP
jgi:hypothetical protein